MTNTSVPATYVENLLTELDDIHAAYAHVLANSFIVSVGSVLGIPEWGWAPSDATVEAERMMLLGRIRDWAPRFRLLFPHPTPAVSQRLDEHLSRLEAWLIREYGAYGVPATPAAAVEMINADLADLRALTEPMTPDDYPTRLVIDTNALIDNPDLAAYTAELGPKYIVHLLPVVLGEIDDLKRAGRTQDLRKAAQRADRRLKGLRTNGNVRAGVRVSGQIYAKFEHVEPKGNHLPSWLDLGVPDDRFVASALLLQSDHPGSALYVATSDINLQTKLSAVGLPFIEPDVLFCR